MDGMDLDKIGKMLGKDQNTINQLKKVLQNPDAVRKMNSMLSKTTGVPTNSTTKTKKIGRNEKCPCNSGKKYKKCCNNNTTNTK